ncbi:hypothetical protein [Paenibacillus taiwanensis]|uniref:hypothetical protein n=1 Tax=Paenibacillus taiwanensis TaxID=401638 RepID=UPI0004127677|nr:hypothetical protein [Paenibacillus taiwanensis]
MTKETINEEPTNNGNEDTAAAAKFTELVDAVHHNALVALRTYYDDVQGQVLNHEVYGPIFIYQVKDAAEDSYVCGFFMRELIEMFQTNDKPDQWMASFFVELMKTKGGKLLPKSPESEDEAKALIDEVLIPQCLAAVHEEFPDTAHAGLGWNEEHGPVFEAGFPAIVEGNNTCAFPIHILMMQMLLNRDPADLILQGLYHIQEGHELNG